MSAAWRTLYDLSFKTPYKKKEKKKEKEKKEI